MNLVTLGTGVGMYGKLFADCFSGSMYGAGVNVFAVWGWVIAHAVKSRVEVNPIKVAHELGSPVEAVEEALEYLTKPDPRSRNKEHEGRRMVKEGEYQYYIPSHEYYRSIRNEDERREYNRRKKAESRAKLKKGTPLPGELEYDKALKRGDVVAAERIEDAYGRNA